MIADLGKKSRYSKTGAEPFSFQFFVVSIGAVAIRSSLLQKVLEHSKIPAKGELNDSETGVCKVFGIIPNYLDYPHTASLERKTLNTTRAILTAKQYRPT